MTEVHFLDNWSGTISNNQVPGVTDNLGINILVELDSYLTKVRYYRHSSASSDRVSQMQVYKWPGGGLLSTVLVPANNGVAGWEEVTLPEPIRIPGGTEIQIVGLYGATAHADYNSAAVPTPPPGFSWVSGHHRMFNPTSSIAFCPNGDNSWFYLIDAAFDTAAVLPEPATSPDVSGAVDNGLADWLISTGDNTHQTDGLPWLTKATVDDTNTKVSNGLNLAGGLQALSDSLAHTLQMASDYVAGRTSTYFTDLKNRLIGASGGGGSAFFGPGGTQVAEGVETLLAQNVDATQLGAEVAKLREELTLSPDLTDTTRWTLVDTATGEGDALVELQADLYRISIGDAVGAPGPQLVAGVEWRPRWGWIAPRVHGCYLQREPLVDVSPIAIAPGLFMDGLLLYSHPGFTWTVEAFVLDRA